MSLLSTTGRISVALMAPLALLSPMSVADTAGLRAQALGSCSVKPVFPQQFVVSPRTRRTPVVLHTSCLLRAPVTLKLFAVCQTGAGPCSQGTVTWPGNRHGVVGDGARAYLARDQELAGADFFPSQPVRVSPLPSYFTASSVSQVVSFKEPHHPIPPNAD